MKKSRFTEEQTVFAQRISRSSFRYRSVAADDSALRLRIKEITETRVHYGYRRGHVRLPIYPFRNVIRSPIGRHQLSFEPYCLRRCLTDLCFLPPLRMLRHTVWYDCNSTVQPQ